MKLIESSKQYSKMIIHKEKRVRSFLPLCSSSEDCFDFLDRFVTMDKTFLRLKKLVICMRRREHL